MPLRTCNASVRSSVAISSNEDGSRSTSFFMLVSYRPLANNASAKLLLASNRGAYSILVHSPQPSWVVEQRSKQLKLHAAP